ncbi:MAG: FAD-binding oxidoreductase [Puniceicoccaceae bacterium]|nr:MAG: FAD-binding oxidoreductase [Puniceicoccaceae bacterium]
MEPTASKAAFERAKADLLAEFRRLRRTASSVRLGKRTSNLFRERRPTAAPRLDVSAFDRVIHIDPEARTAETGGMTPYVRLADACLEHGLMPAVVPELKTITIGGAVTGGGIESSSFRHGFVHETVTELEILTAAGETVVCKEDGPHRDLFFGFPNSYGTLGYALRVKLELVPVRPRVRLEHRRSHDPDTFFGELEQTCRTERADPQGAPFIEGVSFAPDDLVASVGRWKEPGPAQPSDYRFMRIYHRSLRQRETDLLRVRDYLWRWDTDWFWCSRAFGMENPVLRLLAGCGGWLNSATYWKLRHWNERSGLLRRLGLQRPTEWIIQDVEIPVGRAADFLAFLDREVGIRPVWICPAMARRKTTLYPLFMTDPEVLYINFGFWGGVPGHHERGERNRRIEAKVAELGGKKSLYSSSYFSKEEFWRHYNESAYRALKDRYDPNGFFPDLYEKCVLGR